MSELFEELNDEEVKIILQCINSVNIPGQLLEKVYAIKQKLVASLSKGGDSGGVSG